MLKSIKTKATNNIIKEEMANIKLRPADQQLSKIEEFNTKYNISSERLSTQTGFDKGIKVMRGVEPGREERTRHEERERD